LGALKTGGGSNVPKRNKKKTLAKGGWQSARFSLNNWDLNFLVKTVNTKGGSWCKGNAGKKKKKGGGVVNDEQGVLGVVKLWNEFFWFFEGKKKKWGRGPLGF